MKARKATDLKELTTEELFSTLRESEETLVRHRFQKALSQLQDTAYIRTLRKDIARLKTIIGERATVGV
ncbi:MAG: 50S ribosomal protein L29 [Ignavibacteria bacterium]|nr:50S ribosomal protein L29 [Ignavibacteria bacterium]